MRKLLIVMTAIAFVVASCGDDDDDQGSAPPATEGTAGGTETSTASPATEGTAGGTETSTASTESEGTSGGSAPVALEGTVNDKGTAEVGDEVELEMDDYYFEPTFLKAAPGATVHVELENEGDDGHTFTIDALGIDQEVAPGESATVDVTLPQEGAVRFYCRFHGGQGMQGAFFFNEGDAVVTGTTGG
jgi:plastocyanin